VLLRHFSRFQFPITLFSSSLIHTHARTHTHLCVWEDVWISGWNNRPTYYLAACDYLVHKTSGGYLLDEKARRPRKSTRRVVQNKDWMVSENTRRKWAQTKALILHELMRTGWIYLSTDTIWVIFRIDALRFRGPLFISRKKERNALCLGCNS